MTFAKKLEAVKREHDEQRKLEADVVALTAEVRRMRNRIERLRGGLKSAAGWFFDADDLAKQKKCIEMAGDMEPPLNR